MKNTLKQSRKFIRRSVYLPFVVVLLFVAVAGFFVVKTIVDQRPLAVSATGGRIDIEKPIAQMPINKVMNFPLKDDKGDEIAKLKYEILNAELRDQIIVKGQKASAINGRTFLIVNIKITNDFGKPVELRARDYMRLSVNNSKERLASEIHNDPVEVQALSTKYTRLGFPVNETDQNLTLYVGEIGGKKEEIKLNLK